MQAAIIAGDVAGACSLIADFVNQVNALSGKTLPARDAANLAAMANDLKTALSCP